MTILHIITRLILGGAQQNTIICCTAQSAAGHKVYLVYGPIYGPEGSLLPEAQKSGAELIEMGSMRRAILPVHDVLCHRALRKLMGRIKPEVVHTHSSKAGIVGRAAAWAQGVPAVIHTIHGLPFHERQPRLVHGLYVGMERWAAKRCHKLIGVTQAMCDAFVAQSIGRAEQFEVVPSGVDISQFETPARTRQQVREELGIDADAPVVGLVARLDPLKGQDDLLDALPRLLKRQPRTRLLIVGGGWHGQALRARVEKEGLGPHVIFTGLVPPARVAELLGAMDVNTLPSYQEGQPRTLVQALMSGIAVVGYDAGGIGEICLDGQTGRLVGVGDRAALADAIAWLIEHPQERQRMGAQGREFARRRFDARIMVRELERIYSQVLGR